MKENNIQILNMMDLFDSVEENNFLVDLNFDETLIKSWDCIKVSRLLKKNIFYFNIQRHFPFLNEKSLDLFFNFY
jgi:hypothetical protein